MGEVAATAKRRFPALVAFDLECVDLANMLTRSSSSPSDPSYTLWDLYIDTHVTGMQASARSRSSTKSPSDVLQVLLDVSEMLLTAFWIGAFYFNGG
jgi:hypothetical protein